MGLKLKEHGSLKLIACGLFVLCLSPAVQHVPVHPSIINRVNPAAD